MKAKHVYQFSQTDEQISKKRLAYAPVGVYLYAKSIKDNVARCKVLLIKEQPKKKKFNTNSWVYVPVANLTKPDLFPKHTHQPKQWLKLCNQPIMASVLEILHEKSPTIHYELVAALEPKMVLAAKFNPRSFKIGQKFTNKKNLLTIEKRWDRYYIVKDKLGDRQRYTSAELAEKLTTERFKRKKSFDKRILIKAVVAILGPFIEQSALAGILGYLNREM